MINNKFKQNHIEKREFVEFLKPYVEQFILDQYYDNFWSECFGEFFERHPIIWYLLLPLLIMLYYLKVTIKLIRRLICKLIHLND